MLRILTIAIAILIAFGFSDPYFHNLQSSTEETDFSITCARASLLPVGKAPTSPLPRQCQIGEDQQPILIPEPSTSPFTSTEPN
jgi:hypothetical protein